MSGDQAAAVADELRAILAQVTGRDELLGITADTALFGAGVALDSLAGTLLLRLVQRRYGVDVAAEDLNLDALATLGTLADFITSVGGAPPDDPPENPIKGAPPDDPPENPIKAS
ncbi:MAG TPA: acyl carrier protein [Streptosporangiaceae bacterium]|nr:acyl carrier protein [Streptosporangiaceae bacterium]